RGGPAPSAPGRVGTCVAGGGNRLRPGRGPAPHAGGWVRCAPGEAGRARRDTPAVDGRFNPPPMIFRPTGTTSDFFSTPRTEAQGRHVSCTLKSSEDFHLRNSNESTCGGPCMLEGELMDWTADFELLFVLRRL